MNQRDLWVILGRSFIKEILMQFRGLLILVVVLASASVGFAQAALPETVIPQRVI